MGGLIGLVAGLLFLDLFVFHREARKVSFREAPGLSGFWIAVALAFGGFVWVLAGPAVASEYLAAYLIEWSLSLDNVFVWAVILSSFAVPEQYRYHVLGDHFFVRHGGKLCATPLLAALVVIESSDLLFAIDSVPAVLSITSNTFVAYSSIAFAVLGLRHLYFALEGLIDRFVYLHYGLAAILTFVGVKLMLEGFDVHLPIALSLLFIAGVLAAAIVASLVATRGNPRRGTRSR